MKKVTTKQNRVFRISDNQFKICSAIATMVSNIKTVNDSDEYRGLEIITIEAQIHGLKWAAILIDTPQAVVYDIAIGENIQGYQNLNKMTEITYF